MKSIIFLFKKEYNHKRIWNFGGLVMLDEVIQLDKKYYLNTFGDRLPVCFEKGEGMKKML